MIERYKAMIERFQTFLDQIATWSRAMQWAFWAVCITVAFLVWDSTVAALGAQLSAEAKRIESQVAEVNEPTRLDSTLRNAIITYGLVELPREKADGGNAMTEVVNKILGAHRVKNDDYTRTKTRPIRTGSLQGIGRSSQKLEKIIGDIRFEATQENILKVIADLEGSEWIDAISNVRLTKLEGRMIRVDLTIEAWVLTVKKGRRSR